jgi:3-isopropylmalate dehydratase small subunit
MRPFTLLRSGAVPLDRANVDTDAIIPAKFLKTVTRTGLGVHLFEAWRYDPSGAEVPEFPLNRPECRSAQVLVAGENFGCGSSREHAVWALMDHGIRAVIAPSFSEIFYGNSLKNGLLPVVLSREEVSRILDRIERAPGSEITVDLERQAVDLAGGESFRFDIAPFPKRCLLEGLDEIGMTLLLEAEIRRYEEERRKVTPWLFRDIAPREE